MEFTFYRTVNVLITINNKLVQHFVFFQEQTLEQHRLDSGKVEMIQLDELAQVLFERVGAGIILLKFFTSCFSPYMTLQPSNVTELISDGRFPYVT